jgi:hypothetical protein
MRYGATAREFVLRQKSASIMVVAVLVAVFVAIRWLPFARKNQQSPAG